MKLSKAVWGSVSLVGAGCTFAGIATVAFGDVMDTRERPRPSAQCTITEGNFHVVTFYTAWNGYDDVPDDAETRPYSDPTQYEIDEAMRRGEPTPLGGAEQALNDCIKYIDERQGVGLRDVRVNSGTTDENGYDLPIPLGQHPVEYEGAHETARYPLGNKSAANKAIDQIEDHLDLVGERRRAHEAEDDFFDNAVIHAQGTLRKAVTERAEQQDGSWSSWGWRLVERYVI